MSLANPLTYEVSGLRGLLIGQVTDYWLDFGVLTVAAAVGIAGSVALLPAWPDNAIPGWSERRSWRSLVTGSECWGATFTKVSLA